MNPIILVTQENIQRNLGAIHDHLQQGRSFRIEDGGVQLIDAVAQNTFQEQQALATLKGWIDRLPSTNPSNPNYVERMLKIQQVFTDRIGSVQGLGKTPAQEKPSPLPKESDSLDAPSQKPKPVKLRMQDGEIIQTEVLADRSELIQELIRTHEKPDELLDLNLEFQWATKSNLQTMIAHRAGQALVPQSLEELDNWIAMGAYFGNDSFLQDISLKNILRYEEGPPIPERIIDILKRDWPPSLHKKLSKIISSQLFIYSFKLPSKKRRDLFESVKNLGRNRPLARECWLSLCRLKIEHYEGLMKDPLSSQEDQATRLRRIAHISRADGDHAYHEGLLEDDLYEIRDLDTKILHWTEELNQMTALKPKDTKPSAKDNKPSTP